MPEGSQYLSVSVLSPLRQSHSGPGYTKPKKFEEGCPCNPEALVELLTSWVLSPSQNNHLDSGYATSGSLVLLELICSRPNRARVSETSCERLPCPAVFALLKVSIMIVWNQRNGMRRRRGVEQRGRWLSLLGGHL